MEIHRWDDHGKPSVTKHRRGIHGEAPAIVGLPIYARQLALQDGTAIDVKTEASPRPVNKRPRLAIKILSSN